MTLGNESLDPRAIATAPTAGLNATKLFLNYQASMLRCGRTIASWQLTTLNGACERLPLQQSNEKRREVSLHLMDPRSTLHSRTAP